MLSAHQVKSSTPDIAKNLYGAFVHNFTAVCFNVKLQKFRSEESIACIQRNAVLLQNMLGIIMLHWYESNPKQLYTYMHTQDIKQRLYTQNEAAGCCLKVMPVAGKHAQIANSMDKQNNYEQVALTFSCQICNNFHCVNADIRFFRFKQ